MAKTYRVIRAFNYEDTWVTRANEAQVADILPKALLAEYVKRGDIEETETPTTKAVSTDANTTTK